MSEENDDLLNPDEIEALLNSKGSGNAPSKGQEQEQSGPQGGSGQNPDNQQEKTSTEAAGGKSGAGEVLGSEDIEALIQQRDREKKSTQESSAQSSEEGPSSTENLLDQAESDLAAAIAPELNAQQEQKADFSQAKPFQFEEFRDDSSDSQKNMELNGLQDVELDLRIELGRAELLIEDVLKLKSGSVVPLDKLAGDPVDILVNGRLIARGEVLVLNDNFCVRIAEILTPDF